MPLLTATNAFRLGIIRWSSQRCYIQYLHTLLLYIELYLIFVTARCYASAVLAMALCLSVCHKSEIY